MLIDGASTNRAAARQGNPRLTYRLLMTMFDRRNRLSALVEKELHAYFPNRVFQSVIPRSVRLAEAPSYGRSILQYDPHSSGAQAYESLAKEIIALES